MLSMSGVAGWRYENGLQPRPVLRFEDGNKAVNKNVEGFFRGFSSSAFSLTK